MPEKTELGTCPICSHRLEKSSIWISGESKPRPEELRCGSPACIGNREPAEMKLHQDFVAAVSRPDHKGFHKPNQGIQALQKLERKGS